MHIHQLTVSNIGPFSGLHTLDFAALSKSGLFLLEGPTGAGKSTVLDALVFALYGAVATSAGSVDRMRSDVASPGDESFVDLTFETNKGIFRVRRSPAYERVKKVGEGTTSQKMSVSIWHLAGPDDSVGTLLSSRSQEADLEIYRAIGLNRSQFVQTVLLPQGEFAVFLRSSPTDRQVLLQRLFDTGLYDSMATELDHQRKDALSRRSKASDQLRHATTSFVTAAECPPEQAEAIRESEIEPLSVAVQAVLDEVTERRAQAIADHQVATTGLTAARNDLAATEHRNELIRRKRLLLRRAATLQDDDENHRARRLRQKTLTAVRELSPHHQNLIQALAQATDLTGQVRDQEAAITQAGGGIAVPDPELEITRLEAAVRALEPAAAAALRLESTERVLVAARLKESEANEERGPIAGELNLLPGTRAQRVREIEEVQSSAGQVPHLTERRDTCVKQLADAQSAGNKEARVAACRADVASARAIATDAQASLGKLQRARIDGIASELASSLTGGDQCPVCGSTAHPALAPPNENQTTQADVDAADQLHTSVVADLERVSKALELEAIELAALTASAGGHGIGECQVALTESEGALSTATAQKERLPQLQDELSELDHRNESLRSSLSALAEIAVTATEEARNAEADISTISKQVREARGPFDTVPQRIAHLDSQIAALRDLVSSCKALAIAQAQLEVRRQKWLTEVSASAVGSETEYEDLVPYLPELAELYDHIERHETEQRVVNEGLEDPDVVAIDTHADDADLTELQTLVTKCAGVQDNATQELGRRQNRFDAVSASAATIFELVSQLASVFAETSGAIRLAEIVNANSAENLLRVPMPTYVLVSRFKEVLAAANQRLATMSDGRYTIEYLEERESHGRKSGLGINILDRHTERLRQPGDLSGGETFYTALSLALGLADVVVQEAGGVELGTLFIDEGFGSLDSLTLDSVLTEVSHLRAGGRAVGVVSHVDELKQRISDRIEVRKSGDGTSTLRVIA